MKMFSVRFLSTEPERLVGDKWQPMTQRFIQRVVLAEQPEEASALVKDSEQWPARVLEVEEVDLDTAFPQAEYPPVDP